jgi:hypothetical protein
MIKREAKLLETGLYADKAVEIQETDLQRLAEQFTEPVPILVEHRLSPIRLGWLVKVWRKGQELFGQLNLLPEADALLNRLRIRGLSLGITSDLSRILEVSATGSPRVPSAQLFAQSASEAPQNIQEVIYMDTVEITAPAPSENMERMEQLQQQVAQLEHALQEQQVQSRVQSWLRQGKLTPALVPFAEAILGHAGTSLSFNQAEMPLAALFAQFVEHLPGHPLITEQTPHHQEESTLFSMEEMQFLQQIFPDLDLQQLQQNLTPISKQSQSKNWR